MRTLALLSALTLSCFAQPLSPNDPAYMMSTSTLRRGLVGYWRMEESTGTRYDRSSKGNHLTPVGAVISTTGKVGSCCSVTNDVSHNEYLYVNSNSSIQFGDVDFTVGCWVKFDVITTTGMVSKNDATAEYRIFYYAATDGGPDQFGFYVGDNAGHDTVAYASTFGTPTTGVWIYVLGWHDSVANTLNIQVNGGAVDSTAYTFGCFAGPNPLCFGTIGPSSGYNIKMKGKLDEIGIWSRVLTSAERTRLATGVTFPRFSASLPLNYSTNIVLAFEGDSTTPLPGYVSTAVASLDNNIPVSMFASGGSTITNAQSRAANVDAIYDPAKDANVESILLGVNDLDLGGTPSNFVNQLKTYCLDRKAVGWTMIVCTIPSCCADSVNANRATVNSMIRADPSFYDVLCDFAADPVMGTDAACSDGNLFSDGVHPTALGYSWMAVVCATSLRRIIPVRVL